MDRSPFVAAWEGVVEQLFSPTAIFPPETKTAPNLGLGPHFFLQERCDLVQP